MKIEGYHIPVLLQESMAGLSLKGNGIYLDLTFGGGGHAREILASLTTGRLIAFDQDPDAKQNLPDDSRIEFVAHNYRYVGRFLDYLGISKVDGILADLGVSSHHLDAPERGFSFRFDAPLDMRMNQGAKKTAADIVNDYSQDQLRQVLRAYGELDKPGLVAARIVKARENGVLETTKDLVDCLTPILKKGKENKELAKVFQALRIEVNEELDGLSEMLEQSIDYLAEGGRLVVISYHSLEDRLVKNFMRSGKADGKVEQDLFGQVISPLEPITRKVIVPTAEEMERNPRARSAKLRIAAKKS